MDFISYSTTILKNKGFLFYYFWCSSLTGLFFFFILPSLHLFKSVNYAEQKKKEGKTCKCPELILEDPN